MARGIWAGAAGEDVWTTVRGNVVVGASNGIEVSGGAIFYLRDNDVHDSTAPFVFNLGAKAAIGATYTKILHVENCHAYKNGLPQPLDNTLTDVNGTVVIQRRNNFVLTAAGDTDPQDWHQPGDIVNDAGTWKLVTDPGYTPKVATAYTFICTAGNDYVVCNSPGNPSGKFKVGQKVSLPGAGPGGATLTAYIRQFYIASSEYRIKLDTTVSTTVTASTAIGLAQTATLQAV